MGTKDLNQRQILFVEHVLRGESAEKAAIAAGYSPKSARTIGPLVLRNVAVAAELERRRTKLAKTTDDLQTRVIKELEKKAFVSWEEALVFDEEGRASIDLRRASPELLSTINKVKSKTRHVYTPRGEHIATEHHVDLGKDDSLRALQLLGQTLGMFKQDELKVTVDVADRLLSARQRLQRISGPSTDDETP